MIFRIFSLLFLMLAINIWADAAAQTTSWSEFMGGQRKTFSSAGQAKANGFEVSFDYPESWNGVEGRRPHILQQVTSEHGKGLEICNLTVRDLPLPKDYKPTKAEIDELFAPAYLPEWLPKDGVIVRSARTTIDAQPSALIEYRQEMNRAGLSIKMQWVVFPIYYDKKILIFSCGVGSDPSRSWDKMQEIFNAQLPLFQQMASSLIIHSRWKRAP